VGDTVVGTLRVPFLMLSDCRCDDNWTVAPRQYEVLQNIPKGLGRIVQGCRVATTLEAKGNNPQYPNGVSSWRHNALVATIIIVGQ